MNEMNVTAVIISILITVICIVWALLQHYYVKYINYYNTTTTVKLCAPVFEDMISIEDRTNYALDSGNKKLEPDESEVLDFLEKTLKLRISTSQILDLHNVNSINPAVTFKLSGEMDKAMKSFEHTATIAPGNSDILNPSAEFIQHRYHAIVVAEDESNHQALMDQKTTAHILDLQLFKNIDEKRDLLRRLQQTNSLYDAITTQAYYLHIYHTVGIEGNSMSLEQIKYILETGQAIQGKSIMEHNEVLGLNLAMQHIKILTRFSDIGVKEVLDIHGRVLGHVDPINCGTFRDKQVFVGNHIPPSPEDLPNLVNGYIEWLNSEEAQSMHPVRYAALAHYKLADLHPFVDGNGRTSRLIMNLILLRTGYPPVMIPKHRKENYNKYLNGANKGDVGPFVRFIAHCTEDMLDVYIWSTMQFSYSITNLKSAAIEAEDKEDDANNDKTN